MGEALGRARRRRGDCGRRCAGPPPPATGRSPTPSRARCSPSPPRPPTPRTARPTAHRSPRWPRAAYEGARQALAAHPRPARRARPRGSRGRRRTRPGRRARRPRRRAERPGPRRPRRRLATRRDPGADGCGDPHLVAGRTGLRGDLPPGGAGRRRGRRCARGSTRWATRWSWSAATACGTSTCTSTTRAPPWRPGVEAGRPYRIRITHFGDAGRAATRPAPRGRAPWSPSSPGEGLAALCAEAGATVVAGAPRRTARPAASVAEAVRRAHAREVVLLPNDARTARTPPRAAAEQARAEGVRVALIPTRAAVQGIAALAVHEPARRFDEDVVAMTAAAGATRYAELAVAERESWTMAGVCQAGDVLGLIDGDVAVIGGRPRGDRRHRAGPHARGRRRDGHPGPRRRRPRRPRRPAGRRTSGPPTWPSTPSSTRAASRPARC